MKPNSKFIDLSAAQHEAISELLKCYLPDTEVWAYGSRVNFTAKPHSDLDLVAFSSTAQSLKVADLKEAFEESDIPFRIDLFVWDELPEEFHKNIQSEHILLQEKTKRSRTE